MPYHTRLPHTQHPKVISYLGYTSDNLMKGNPTAIILRGPQSFLYLIKSLEGVPLQYGGGGRRRKRPQSGDHYAPSTLSCSLWITGGNGRSCQTLVDDKNGGISYVSNRLRLIRRSTPPSKRVLVTLRERSGISTLTDKIIQALFSINGSKVQMGCSKVSWGTAKGH